MRDGLLQPSAFILLRALSGFLFFWSFALLRPQEPVARKDFGRLLLCGLFGVAINQLFFFNGLTLTSPISASLIMTTAPILVLVVSALLRIERITPRKIVGIALGAAGACVLIAYGKEIVAGDRAWLGNLLVFINASSYGTYLVLVRQLMRKYHPITVVKWVFTFGALFILPLGVPQALHTDWTALGPMAWLGVGYVLVAVTILTYLFNAFALRVVNPSVVSIYIYLHPLFAAVIALALGKDTLGLIKVLAGTLIFAGVFLVSTRNRRKSVQQKLQKV